MRTKIFSNWFQGQPLQQWKVKAVITAIFFVNCAAPIAFGENADDNLVNSDGESLLQVESKTQGEPWPKPQSIQNFGHSHLILRPKHFKFEVIQNTCEILEKALERYKSIILPRSTTSSSTSKNWKNFGHKLSQNDATGNHSWESSPGFEGYLHVLQIDLMNPCSDDEWPQEGMDESYKIYVASSKKQQEGLEGRRRAGTGILRAPSIWGILRALETFSQILYRIEHFTVLKLKTTKIYDFPRFSYRSVLLDTSRHFLPKQIIFQNLDLMAMNKYNVFHWHIVDSQSFPYQSRTFPELSNKGAYNRHTHIYTKQDVEDILEYARLRGIRVIPEFDTPGHTGSWGHGQPNLLTPCYDPFTEQPTGKFGPIDPTSDSNFEFLRQFFQEIDQTFQDQYLHLGGDEVDFDCWQSNPKINKFMKRLNFGKDFTKLENYYMQNLLKTVTDFRTNSSSSYIVWQEVFDNKVKLDPANTIIHIWQGDRLSASDELNATTAAGFRTLLSSCWYLNYISYGIDWYGYYACDPHNFPGTKSQKNLVLGGGPAMWGEMIDETNLIPTLWPRAAVPAERLWSDRKVKDIAEAKPRLEEHRCRLRQRGFQVQPVNGAGFCNFVN